MLNIRVEHFIVALGFTWIGLTLGISFFAAPIKFLAPNVPLEHLLAVGKITFSYWLVLERWLMVLLVVLMFCRHILPVFNVSRLLLFSLFIIMLVQQIWVFPMLDEQTNRVIQDGVSSLTLQHHHFVILEILKILILLVIAVFALTEST